MLKSMAATAVNRPLLIVVACALIDSQGRVLLGERPQGKNFAGLWEFPGGKVEIGETPEQALIRELEEEIGVKVSEADLQPLNFSSHASPDFHLLMPLYLCHSYSGTPQGREGQRLQWVAPEQLEYYPMPQADKPLIAVLQATLFPHP